MRVLKSLFIAFSIYSRIPVPQFAWKAEDMKYTFCFFPWIGAVIGGCLYFWNRICAFYGIGNLCRVLVCAAIPLLITGGFHVDGFLDVMDAFHSYQPRDKKLEILSDAHIGAFAVIMFAVYGLLYLGAFSEIKDEGLLQIVCCGFFLSRCLSGIGVFSLPLAKQEGMLHRTAGSSQQGIVKMVLYVQAMACMVFMLFVSVSSAMPAVAAAFLSFAYYSYRCRKEFGGITGDTSGYFVLLSELCILVTAAVIHIAGV